MSEQSYYTRIIASYLRYGTLKEMVELLREYHLTFTEIDVRITGYMRYYDNYNYNNYNEDFIITCYINSLYNLLKYWIESKKYLYLSKNICHHATTPVYNMILHAYTISKEFKCDPYILIYLQPPEIEKVLYLNIFFFHELCEWHNKWSDYMYDKGHIKLFIENKIWQMSLRCCWITACIIPPL